MWWWLVFILFEVFGSLTQGYSSKHFVIPAGNPVAASKSIVQIKNVRFTVLTSAMIRVEKTIPNGSFEDRQTMVVFNRLLPVPLFSIKTIENGVQIVTKDLTLTYLGGGSTFTPSNLKIEMKTKNFLNVSTWRYGDSTYGNLFGTFRTYDTLQGFQDLNCTRHKPWVTTSEPEHCAFGFASQSGFSIFDDSRSPVLYDNWVHPNLNGKCDAASTNPCFGADFNAGGYRHANKTACIMAGCCWQGRETSAFIDLSWYTNGVENVLTTSEFPLPSNYKVVNSVFNGPPVGQLYKKKNYARNLFPLKLWKKVSTTNSSYIRHYTTASILGEKDAIAKQFSLVGVLGYLSTSESTRGASQQVKLFYCEATDDHFSSIDNCEACFEKNYTFIRNQGFLFPESNLCTMRNGNEDFYFFGHGDNYKLALYDFSLIAGKIPIPRRHMLGVSWSRWANEGEEWNGNQTLQHDAVLSISNAGFPLDTFVFDMNWHLKPQWTGYTWDTSMYPNPLELLSFLHNDRGLYIGANLHDAQGVMAKEKEYQSMAKFVNQSDGKTITFHISSPEYADGLQQTVLEPLTKDGNGFDFWWIDWQQGLQGFPGIGTTDIAGLNPTAWLNHYRTMNYTQAGSKRRPQIHSRFGGLGGHRYTTQFGGDVVQTWDSLLAMIYTTAISTNVLTAHWAQEIMQNKGEHELFTRVAQFGAWGPIFTIWGNQFKPCNIWSDDFPQPYREAVRVHLLQRAMLIPYRYTLARIAHDEGLGLLRPMYYDYPRNKYAYSGHYNSLPQYMLGDDILVAPPYTKLIDPTNPGNSFAKSYTIWLPTDVEWVKLFNTSVDPTAMNVSGWGQVSPLLHQVPTFVKAGSMIPILPDHLSIVSGSASRSFSNLEWWIFPSSKQDKSPTTAWCYEDDGLSMDYIRNKSFVNMTIKKEFGNNKEEKYTLSQQGNYHTAPQERILSLRLIDRNSSLIFSIHVNNVTIRKSLSCDVLLTETKLTMKPFFCDGIDDARQYIYVWLGSDSVRVDRLVVIKEII